MLLPVLGVALIVAGIYRHYQGEESDTGDKGDKARAKPKGKRPSRADELAEARRDAKAQVLAEKKLESDAAAKAETDKRAAIDAAKAEIRKEMAE